jgi:uncharacterized membrane protein
MRTKRGLERIIFFTDAVAAIAITLLILPLVDAVPVNPPDSATVSSFLGSHFGQIGSFALSFVVIARFWMVHHAVFEHVEGYNTRLLTLSLVWAFSIVLLPLPTAITSAFDSSPLSIGLYIGTMLLCSLSLTAITLVVRGNPELESAENPVTLRAIVNGVVSTASIAFALIIGVAIPHATYWGLLVLTLSGPISAFVLRRLAKRATRHPT